MHGVEGSFFGFGVLVGFWDEARIRVRSSGILMNIGALKI